MKDELKTKKQLIDELLRLQEQIAELKEKGKGAQERKKEAKTEEPSEVGKDKKLRILMLEDVAVDAELVEHQLQSEGILFSSKRVYTKEGFLKELRDFSPDLILADYSLPQFDGLSALAIAQEQSPEVPFILITGTMGEEFAIETLKKGATDYVLKQRLSRLVPSVKRALREVEEKIELKRAEEALRDSEEKYRVVFENTGTATIIFEEDMTISLANRETEKLSGYSKEEIEGKKRWTEFVSKDDLEKMRGYHIMRRVDPSSVPKNYEFRMIDRQGNVKNIFLTIDMIPGTKKSIASLLDITERRKSREELERARREWEEIFQAIGQPTIILDPKHNVIMANRAVVKATGKTEEELSGRKCYEIFHNSDRPPESCPLEKMLVSGNLEVTEMEMEALDGVYLVSCTPVLDEKGHLHKVIHIATDITDRKKTEERLRLLTSVVEQASEGVAVVDLEGNLLFLNDAFAVMHGYTPDELIGKHLSIFHIPEQMPAVEAANREILEKGKFSGKIWHVRRDGTVFPSLMHNSVLRDDAGDLIGMIGTLRDITDIEETEDALNKSKEELNKRIRELEDFYNLAVGRELRMIELKKEIESLKEELQKYKKQ